MSKITFYNEDFQPQNYQKIPKLKNKSIYQENPQLPERTQTQIQKNYLSERIDRLVIE